MNKEVPEKLLDYRSKIDELDTELIDVLARRFQVVKNVGHLKVQEGMSVVQPSRAQEVVDKAMEMGSENGLDPEFIKQLYNLMISHAHDLEDEILEQS